MVRDNQRALSALSSLDSGCSRDEWVRIGMAAKDAGLPFEDFLNWSSTASNYKGEKDCRSAWESFKEGGGITGATLFKLALDAGWRYTEESISFDAGKIKSASASKEKTIKKPQSIVLNKWADEVCGRCVPAHASHAYIARKSGSPDGLLCYPDTAEELLIGGINVAGYLAVPCFDEGEIQTIQFIPPGDGRKLNLTSASFGNAYFVVGNISDKVYISEGIGQAWAINQTTGCAAIVTFGAGRMKKIAKIIHDKYPDATLVIVPDRGKEQQAQEIAADVCGQWIELPSDKDENYDVNDYMQEYGEDALVVLLSCLKAPVMQYRLLSGADIIAMPPMRWIVKKVLPASGLSLLFGESRSGKSFLVLDLIFSIAEGAEDWFGFRVAQMPVIYVCLEGEAGIGKRIQAWSKHHDRPIPQKLKIITQPVSLLIDNDVSELAKAILGLNFRNALVVIDTLNRAAPGAEENSSKDMGLVITHASKLQSLIGGAVLLVHHTGKDKAKGPRGHSSLFAALDSAIEVKLSHKQRIWSVAKSKDDESGQEFAFRLEKVDLGIDEEGDDITSCVVIGEPSKNVLTDKPLDLGSNQKTILLAIDDLLMSSSYSGEGGAPEDSNCIKFDDAVSLSSTKLVLVEEKRQKERAKDAIRGLVSKNILDSGDGWLWRI